MKREQIIAELERLARLLGIEVRYERMGVLAGGLCRIEDTLFIFINISLSQKSRIDLLASELRNFHWDDHFVVPEVRRIIENR